MSKYLLRLATRLAMAEARRSQARQLEEEGHNHKVDDDPDAGRDREFREAIRTEPRHPREPPQLLEVLENNLAGKLRFSGRAGSESVRNSAQRWRTQAREDFEQNVESLAAQLLPNTRNLPPHRGPGLSAFALVRV